MKRNFKVFLISTLLIAAPLFMFAQQPPSPFQVPTDGKEVGAGAGAPIGNGTFILIGLAAAYAIRKVYQLQVVKEEVTE